MSSTLDIPGEKRLELALEAIRSRQLPSIRAAASLYQVSLATLSRRLRGQPSRCNGQAPNRKLTPIEEQALRQRIISLDERGFSPALPFVRKMANLLLQKRVPGASVGQLWVSRFMDRDRNLKTQWTRKYDYRRAKCEDPDLLKTWFDRVDATIQQFGIAAEDIYNFDETGFQMGVIATTKVVTQKKTKGRPKVKQPGNRNFVTVIEGINATGWALPPTIIFEGKVHQSSWYRTGIPSDWTIGLSENGWTNDDLGYKWLTEVFEKHTRHRTTGTYRLLLLDGHGSHLTPEFDDFCRNNQIVWLCPPPHSTHLTQALDVGCFSQLKATYGRLVFEKAQLDVHQIDKVDFLELYLQARTRTINEKTIKSAFRAVGIVPFDPQQVLSRLKPRTPSPKLQPQPAPSEGQLPFQTPHNILDVEAQIQAFQRYRTDGVGLPQNGTSPTDEAFRCMAKSTQLAMHSATLLAEENSRLREEITRQKRKKQARRSYVAQGGILTAEEGLQLVQDKAQRKGGGGATAQRLCGICRLPGHNRKNCSEIQDPDGDSIQNSIHVAY